MNDEQFERLIDHLESIGIALVVVAVAIGSLGVVLMIRR